MTARILLVIGLVMYAALAEYAHRRLFKGYRKQKGSLLRALDPELGQRHWNYVVTSRGLAVGAGGVVGYVAGRIGFWAHPLLYGAFMGIAFSLLWAVRLVVGWALGFYPVSGGLRTRYIVERVPLRTLLIDLALALPGIGFLCGILILWPRS